MLALLADDRSICVKGPPAGLRPLALGGEPLTQIERSSGAGQAFQGEKRRKRALAQAQASQKRQQDPADWHEHTCQCRQSPAAG